MDQPGIKAVNLISSTPNWFLMDQKERFDLLLKTDRHKDHGKFFQSILDGTERTIRGFPSSILAVNITIAWIDKFDKMSTQNVLLPGITIEDIEAHPEFPWDFQYIAANPNFVGRYGHYQELPMMYKLENLVYAKRTTKIADNITFKYWHNLPLYYPVDWYPALVIGYALLARKLKTRRAVTGAGWILINLPFELLETIACAAFYQRRVSKESLRLVKMVLGV